MKGINSRIHKVLLLIAASLPIFLLDINADWLKGASLLYILICGFNFQFKGKYTPLFIGVFLSTVVLLGWFVKSAPETPTEIGIYRSSSLVIIWSFTIYFRLQFYFRNKTFKNFEEYKSMWRRRFYTISGLAFFKLLIVTALIYTILGDGQVQNLFAKEHKKLKVLEIEKRKDLNKVYSDVILISNFNDIKNYGENRVSVEQDLLKIIRVRPLYDQIKILDLSGKEVIRVNGGRNAKIVEQSRLEDKSAHEYFNKSLSLTEKQVYISPLSFNQEFGKIEIPYKPVVHVSKPIFRKKQIVGILVINYLTTGDTKITPSNEMRQPNERLSVLNNFGTLLYRSPESQIKGSVGQNLRSTQPKFWKIIDTEATTGIVEIDGDYFLGERLSLNEVGDHSLHSGSPEQIKKSEELILLKAIPNKIVTANFHRHFWLFVSVFLVIIFLFITIVRHQYLQMKREELSRVKFESVFNNTYEFIGLLNPKGELIEINNTALQFVGMNRKEVLGMKVWDAPWWSDPEMDREKIRNSVENARNGSFIRYELGVTGKEGQKMTIDFTLRPVFDNNKNVIYIIPEGYDITEKNALQKELISANESFKKIQELAKVGVWRVDTKKMTAHWDEQVYAIHEIPVGTEITVEKAINFYHLGYRELIQNAVEKGIANNSPWDIEAIIVTATGKELWVRAIGYPVYIRENLVELRGMFMDINAQVLRDQKIQSLNESLEKKVEERTKKLALANQKLDEANKELETFSYSVSHDLKAPLRALQGFSKNLVAKYSDNLDETGIRWLNFISQNAQSMDDLIQDMLTFSKMNKKQLEKVEVDMEKIVENQIEKFKIVYPKETKITVLELPPAHCDKTMLETAWQNLIGNAFKYSNKNSVIKIEIGSYSDEEFVYYYVKDEGVGFDMRFKDKLFGVFQRLHHSNDFEGSGVGLASVQRILLKHDGEIFAEGAIDKGATFTLKLPKLTPGNEK